MKFFVWSSIPTSMLLFFVLGQSKQNFAPTLNGLLTCGRRDWSPKLIGPIDQIPSYPKNTMNLDVDIHMHTIKSNSFVLGQFIQSFAPALNEPLACEQIHTFY